MNRTLRTALTLAAGSCLPVVALLAAEWWQQDGHAAPDDDTHIPDGALLAMESVQEPYEQGLAKLAYIADQWGLLLDVERIPADTPPWCVSLQRTALIGCAASSDEAAGDVLTRAGAELESRRAAFQDGLRVHGGYVDYERGVSRAGENDRR